MSTTHIAPPDGAIATSDSSTTMSDSVALTTQLATTISTTHIAISDAATATSDSSTTMSEPPAVITQIATTIPQIAGNPSNHRDPSCFPAGHSPMERMPKEILTQICGLAVPETKRAFGVTKRPSYFKDTGIRALALASKRMNPSAQRAMYDSIVLGDDEKSLLLLRSLLQSAHNRELVRHLEVRPPVKVVRLKDAKYTDFVDVSKILDTIFEGERRNPQLPPELLDDLKEEFDQLPGEAEWLEGEYPQGGFNTVTRAIIFLCQNIQSFKVQIMGEWSGSSCDYTRTQPRSLLSWDQQPAIAFNHLRVLDLDVASITDFSKTPDLLGDNSLWDITCPPTVQELTLRHEDASLSRNFFDPYDEEDDDEEDDFDLDDIVHTNDSCSLDDLFRFLKPCAGSLLKLRLLGGFDHAGLDRPNRLFTPQWVSKHNWNTILPHFQQLVHLEFSGYSDPCPPDDAHRHTWPDNYHRYGIHKTITCLDQLPKLRYLKLPLVDLFPLSPDAFPDTCKGVSALALSLLPGYQSGMWPAGMEAVCLNHGLRKRIVECMEVLSGTVEGGLGSHHNVREKLRQAAGGEEIPRNLEKVELYHFVEDTDKSKDPRERWTKSSQYASLDRREIEWHEEHMACYAGWFPTEEKTITWTRGY